MGRGEEKVVSLEAHQAHRAHPLKSEDRIGDDSAAPFVPQLLRKELER
jgi:hypothetical protein